MRKRHIGQDLLLVAGSVVVTWVIVRFEVVAAVLAYTGANAYVAAFLAGSFFTSLATTVPAMAVLGELSLSAHPLMVALVGGAGAVVGDYLLFAFIRDRVSDDIAYVLAHTGTPRFFKLFHRKTFRRLVPFIGGLIIASPLPDELGLTLLGLSRMRTGRFVLLSFIFNTIGILLIGLAARALAS